MPKADAPFGVFTRIKAFKIIENSRKGVFGISKITEELFVISSYFVRLN